MKRTELKRKKRLHRRPLSRKKRYARGLPMEHWELKEIAKDEFKAAARAQGCCQVTGSREPWDAHHVIEKSWLKSNAPGLVWDSRNALRVAQRIHERHTNAFRRIPQRALTDENIAFAFEVMGQSALFYLRRLYDGHDERIELAYSELEVADATA